MSIVCANEPRFFQARQSSVLCTANEPRLFVENLSDARDN